MPEDKVPYNTWRTAKDVPETNRIELGKQDQFPSGYVDFPEGKATIEDLDFAQVLELALLVDKWQGQLAELIADAAEAHELFGSDELEAHAARLRGEEDAEN